MQKLYSHFTSVHNLFELIVTDWLTLLSVELLLLLNQLILPTTITEILSQLREDFKKEKKNRNFSELGEKGG